MRTLRKSLSVFLSIILVTSVCPAPALAGDSGESQATSSIEAEPSALRVQSVEKHKGVFEAGGAAKLHAQRAKKSSKVKMWVVTEKDDRGEDYFDPVELKYSYNSKGLLVRKAGYYDGDYASTRYTYDSSSRLKSSKTWGERTSYTLDKMGRVVAGDGVRFAYNSKGRLASDSSTYRYGKKAYKYNSKGKLKSAVHNYINGDRLTSRSSYHYDRRGSLAKTISTSKNLKSGKKSKATTKWTNTYKNGLLVKAAGRVKPAWRSISWPWIITYKYKKVSVPRALVKMVRAQQFAIVTDLLPIEAAHR